MTSTSSPPSWAVIAASLRRLGAAAIGTPPGLSTRIMQRIAAAEPPCPPRPLPTFRILITPPDRQPTRPLPKAS